MNTTAPLLLGNTFPLSLMRRRVIVEQVSVEELRAAAAQRPVRSFWGHASTLAAAEEVLGFPAAPRTDRLALTLSENELPVLDGEEFTEAWVLSPRVAHGHRPAPGAETPPAAITGWSALHLTWI